MPNESNKNNRRQHWTASPIYSVAFLLVFVFAFFPDLFIGALQLPFGRRAAPAPSSCDCAPQSAAPTGPASMSWFQKTFTLPARSRGSYLITDDVLAALPELSQYRVGILHLFAQHTSCALSLNENWDADVRADMSDALDRIAPADPKGRLYRHAAEGEDDMPAHIKAALVGASVAVPITDGRLATGTWQGIWYLEFRTAKHARKLVATIQGEKR